MFYFYFSLDKRSFQRRSSQPISWLVLQQLSIVQLTLRVARSLCATTV